MAKSERRRTELYAMDLLYLLVKTKYDISTEMPSKCEGANKPKDRRSADEIKKDLLKRLESA